MEKGLISALFVMFSWHFREFTPHPSALLTASR